MEFLRKIVRAKLGPVPVPYIFLIALIPLWMSFSSNDTSLLLSMVIIATIVLKGSLLSYWVLNKVKYPLLQIILLFGVNVLQIVVFHGSLDSSVIPIIFLVPLSNVTGVLIFMSHIDDLGEDKHNQPLYKRGRSTQVIVIFSRSSEDQYEWLSALLREVGKVVHFPITNNNYQQFTQQVSQCTFAILYHTKRHGRVNITNVTDSLYDDEVDYMSKTLGKNNVIVVADDLDDSSSTTKNNILKNQKSIQDLTRDLFLFTTQEKTNKQLIRDKIQPIIAIHYQGSSDQFLALLVLGLVPWIYFALTVCNVSYLITTNVNGSFLLYSALFSLNSTGSLLPSAYPIHRPRSQPHLRGKNKDVYRFGFAVVLVLTVAELFMVFWISSVINMVLLIMQSVATAYAAVVQVV
ncbi:uncharacterized protein LOC142097154 isoform X2 [Mixophyes fleayi]|uniref:uncharacterized protein LOC142097154 isoform X2 n=1 Tax=Mixophyes fleayi TaxID=3061075 RepID=UPI003F4D85EE